MEYKKPSLIHYRIAQAVSWVVSTLIFGRRIRRNELRGVKGPFVVVANHQAALDFVNLIGLTSRRMTFVISRAFYSTLPIRRFLDKLGVIPKQQFQTALSDMKRCRAVIDAGEPLVIYPAGLMCEDGLSTPIPGATYKFLRWLNADVYAARTRGAYFVMPKWSGKLRPGRTEMDVYKLFTKEELQTLSLEEIKKRTDEALLFDACREQEKLRAVYAGGDNVRGLENVLYICPHCGGEFTIDARKKNLLRCCACGFAAKSDRYGFLREVSGFGTDVRHVSDWSRKGYEAVLNALRRGEKTLSSPVRIHMIDRGEHKFRLVGAGLLALTEEGFALRGMLRGKPLELRLSINGIPTLPFKPGRHLDIQNGQEIYRCLPRDGRLVMKFINMVKAFHALREEENR